MRRWLIAGVLALAVGIAILWSGALRPPAGVAGPLPGDPRAGLSVFKNSGCAVCHAIATISTGQFTAAGTPAGPSLDGEGARHTASWFMQWLPRHARARAPSYTLAHREIVDLAAFLLTLR